jgi:ribosomal protein S14
MTMFQNLSRSMDGHERLSAQCEGCGRKTVWTKVHACRLFGPSATPADIRRRLVCKDCGQARARVWI